MAETFGSWAPLSLELIEIGTRTIIASGNKRARANLFQTISMNIFRHKIDDFLQKKKPFKSLILFQKLDRSGPKPTDKPNLYLSPPDEWPVRMNLRDLEPALDEPSHS